MIYTESMIAFMNDLPDGSINNGLIFLRLLVMRQKLELEDEENGTFSDGGSLSRFIAIRASAHFSHMWIMWNMGERLSAIGLFYAHLCG